jgi:hypothetical protein
MTILNDTFINLNANELSYQLLKYYSHISLCVFASDKLRQQAKEIEQLTITNQDLKYQLIKKSGEQVLDDFSKDKLITDNQLLKAELRLIAEQLRKGVSKIQQKTLARAIEENLNESN